MRTKGSLLGSMTAAAIALPTWQAAAQTGTADRLYVMDCGHNAATDQSRWSPGVNAGKPIELSDNCYLIRHGSDWLPWDTGYPDSVAEKPVTGPTGTASSTCSATAARRSSPHRALRPATSRRLHLPKTGWLMPQEDLRPDGAKEGRALDQPRQAAESGLGALLAILRLTAGRSRR